ncbi:S41 family peptidase [Paenibacillus sp. FJAT-27812]|uniref:S41 family peptidase n=1 Tax=Paenibacillus sp. FJAT-27812 TaxID=1684143 RepID=UPI0006A76254|nr:S41 family peptidase [Paenibacillus sp. FJAT-27812]
MGIYGLLDSVKWLTPFEMLLCVLNLVLLVRHGLPQAHRSPRWLDYLPSLGMVIVIASLWYGDRTLLAMLFYSITVIVFLCTVKRILRFNPLLKGKENKLIRIVRPAICVIGIISIAVATLNAGVLRYNPASDLSEMSYEGAFVKMNERLSREYPFGSWKGLKWDELQVQYSPLFEHAEKNKDKELYYKLLRDYLSSIGDGHIKLMNHNIYEDDNVFKEEVGGGFGISTVQLDNGKVRVSLVLEGSPAYKNGIRLGAEIVSWNGKSGKDAFEETSWSESFYATDEVKAYFQGRLMARAPIGQEVKVAYRNLEEKAINEATLKAYDDQYETLKETKVQITQKDLDASPVEGSIIGDGYGYVKIKHFLAQSTFPAPDQSLAQQLKQFQKDKVKGLVIDLRDNPGGEDSLAAAMAGFFVSEKKHYEYVSYYNRNTGRFEINHNEVLTVKPQKVYYDGSIAILINSRTGSSGEGMPLVLKGLPNVKIIGFTATAGSFGIVSRPIEMRMPEGYVIRFPDGRSLNANKRIQGDGDAARKGGVAPDVRIPLDEQTFIQKYVDGQDIELNYALKILGN